MKTTINPKLTAALSTIAILAPAATAQATGSRTPPRAARHVAIIQQERHWSARPARRSTAKFQRDGHWG
jgi:hypothetical protein